MNNDRRKVITRAEEIMGQVGVLIEEAKELMEEVQGEEQSYFDDMHENFQNGERGQAANDCIEIISEIVDALEEAESTFGGLNWDGARGQ